MEYMILSYTAHQSLERAVNIFAQNKWVAPDPLCVVQGREGGFVYIQKMERETQCLEQEQERETIAENNNA